MLGLTENLQAQLDALRHALSFAPPWAASFVVLITAVAVAWIVHAIVLALVRGLVRSRRPFLRSILEATKSPTRLALLLLAIEIALPTTPLGLEIQDVLERFLAIGTIFLLGWIALTTLHIGANLYLNRFRLDVADNVMARKHVTQVRVLLRALDTIIVIATVGFALMTFESVRQFGVSLFASAGVAGLIFGLAAQPVLSNLIAGVQLGMTQPIRLEDAVTVENEFGWIEEINSTYVVIRLWDLRRLIVPLNYFSQKPFYNWTRHSATTVGNIMLYLDYAAPIDIVRQKAIEFVANSKAGEARVTSVQVTNATAQAIEVRVLVTGASPGITSNVCADVRERLIAYLQKEHREALPRQRSEAVSGFQRNAAPSAG